MAAARAPAAATRPSCTTARNLLHPWPAQPAVAPRCTCLQCLSMPHIDAGYANPIGVHALVFAGDWSEASASAAVAGAKAAGYDMVSEQGCTRLRGWTAGHPTACMA